MVQIALLKSREATVVALVHVLHRRRCRDAARFRDSAGLQKYPLDSPPTHPHPLGCCFTPCIVGTFVHLQLHGCLICSNFACGERSCGCHCCRLLKEQKSGGMSGWKGNQVKGTKEVSGHSLSHCRRPSLFWSRPAGRSTPSSDPPGSAGSASASRGRQRAQTGERSETIPELFQQLNSIYFANECF